ncbi:unnamed protein product [Phytomonas sp. EM1]|nr:unnamed protein product [Phytomonas sp. EM1]|eukprot:CCW63907.1 unnamed protein product [Phytomonas sp. isolate EM1]
MSRFDRANHWCGDSRLHLGPATSLSTLAGHIYKCDSNGSCVQQAYASTVEEVVRAYKTIFPFDIGNNAESSKRMPTGSEMGFVWIDLHGVPPPPHHTTNDSDKGKTMNHLWEALQLNQKHRVRLQEEIRQEYQRRTTMFGKKEVDTANAFPYAIPVTHPNNEGDGTTHTIEEGQLTLPPDFECFCMGYGSEDRFEALDDADTIHLFAKPTPINCQGGNKEECYAVLRVMTLLEHTVHHIPQMGEQIPPPYLISEYDTQVMFHKISYPSNAFHDNPFIRPCCHTVPTLRNTHHNPKFLRLTLFMFQREVTGMRKL